MHLNYLPLHFVIKFARPVLADNYPSFVLRSILGYQLKSLSCVQKTNYKCDKCIFKKSCAFAQLFESVIEKNNEILPGTIRSTHPFAITNTPQYDYLREPIEYFTFSIMLFGQGIDFLPHIITAIMNGGKNGIFKMRVPFEVVGLSAGEKEILSSDGSLKLPTDPFVFNIPTHSGDTYEGSVLIKFVSPCRMQIKGQYNQKFSAQDFWTLVKRRVITLCQYYGNYSDDFAFELNLAEQFITDRQYSWQDYTHYSSRQKTAMDLGGVQGRFKLVGRFTDQQMEFLDFVQMANIGKNAGFGLGQLDFEEFLK